MLERFNAPATLNRSQLVPMPATVLVISQLYVDPPFQTEEAAVIVPTIFPGLNVEPLLRVKALNVPLPEMVAFELTVVALLEIEPVTCNVPSFTTVVPV